MTMPPSGSEFSRLEYAVPVPQRPGILTAVGVLSIIVGAMSVLGSLGGMASGIMYLTMGGMTPIAPAAPLVATTIPAAPAGQGGSGVTTYNYVSTATAPTRVPVVVGSPFPFHIARGASVMTLVEAAMSFCVAVLLIVAGILMLRDSVTTLRLHRIYVVLKVPLILVAAFATWWMYSDLMANISTMGANGGGAALGTGFGNTMAVVQAVIWAGIALIYPIALLIVLSTQTSKEHFKRIRFGTTG